MRTSLVLFAFAFTSAFGAAADDPCGDPVLVSQGYPSYTGTVLAVLDPLTLRVEIPDALALYPNAEADFQALAACHRKPCKVRLVNFDPPRNPGLAALARRNLLKLLGASKRVTLAISPVQDASGVVNALVTTDPYKRRAGSTS